VGIDREAGKVDVYLAGRFLQAGGDVDEAELGRGGLRGGVALRAGDEEASFGPVCFGGVLLAHNSRKKNL